MDVSFSQIKIKDYKDLEKWLCSDTWDYFGKSKLTPEDFNESMFFNEKTKCFWVIGEDRTKVGLIKIFDLNDPTPLFDIRLKTEFRSMGFGEKAVKWIVDYIFTTFKDKIRIEAFTREDNLAMRKILIKCGFAKEAHHRKAWNSDSGILFDAVGYGILKDDWQNKKLTPVNWKDLDFE